MKTLFLLLVTSALLLIISNVYAEDEWIQYTNGQSVNAIVEDGDYLWIGTYGGLVKMDKSAGEKSFYNNYNSGLRDNWISSIAIDDSGNKWFGTIGGGVAKYDGVNWTVYNTSNSGLPNNNVFSIAIDSNKNKWFGTQNGGAKFDEENWTVYNTSNSGLPNNWISSIAIDRLGNIWLGTLSGITTYNGKDWTLYDTSNSDLPNNGINEIAIDELGDKWFGTYSGIAKFDDENWTVYDSTNSGLPSNYVVSITIDDAGNQWFGTRYGGVAKYDSKNWMVYDSTNSGLPSNYVVSIIIDNAGNKWFGTTRIGATRLVGTSIRTIASCNITMYDGENWTIYNPSNSGLIDNWVNSIAIDKLGNKWFGTQGGIAKFDDENWTIYDSSNSDLPDNWVNSIAIDGLGNKWFGTYNGIAKFDGENWTIYDSSNSGLNDNLINSIAIDGLGNKWFGTYNGIAKYSEDNWTIYNKSNSGLPSNNVYSILSDDLDNLWIGTSDGVTKYDSGYWTVYNTSTSGLPLNYTVSIAMDSSGNKWFGTYFSGAAKYDGENWTIYNKFNSGLTDNFVSSIAIDGLGNKWFGIFRVYNAHFFGAGIAILIENVQNISTSVTKSEYCACEDIYVYYNASGNFSANNTFTVHLSDKSGNFSNPTIIGQINSASSGTISSILPDDAEGNKYRIRVVSSNPEVIGNDNGKDITIHPLPEKPTIEKRNDTLFSSVAISYQWYYNGTVLNSANEKFLVPDTSGYYSVEISDENGCSSISNDYYYEKTTVNENPRDNLGAFIIPNPLKNKATIKFRTGKAVRATITITDAFGREVKRLADNEFFGSSACNLSFDASDLPSGVYYVVMRAGGEIQSEKFVVLR